MLKGVNLCPLWWAKLCDFISKANTNRFFTRKRKFNQVQLRPMFVSQSQMLSQDSFGSLIVNGHQLCRSLQTAGRCKLWATVGAVETKYCVCASLTFLGTKISNGGNGLDCPDVVQREINRQRLEEIVQTDAITYRTS